MRFVSQQDMTALGDPRYRDRWGYFREAIHLAKSIPTELHPSDVLEIGPYKLPLVPGCHTMDNRDHRLQRTYAHDATHTPWPIRTGQYKLVVALQVFEHLAGRQHAAWQEVVRVARWAIVSVPYEWPDTVRRTDHVGITSETLAEWFGRQPVDSVEVPSTTAPAYSRLVCLYDLGGD